MAGILEIVPEDDLKEAIISEYKRKVTLYKLTDEKFRKKYRMSFEEFDKKIWQKKKVFYGRLNLMPWNGNMQLRALDI